MSPFRILIGGSGAVEDIYRNAKVCGSTLWTPHPSYEYEHNRGGGDRCLGFTWIHVDSRRNFHAEEDEEDVKASLPNRSVQLLTHHTTAAAAQFQTPAPSPARLPAPRLPSRDDR